MSGRVDGGQQLPCGQAWDDLVEQVADGRPEPRDGHQERCPHCQAALAETARLWQPLRALAAEPVRAPAGLTARVMRRVREAARESWHGLLPTERGTTRVAARVVAALARQAARRVPGVATALGRTTEPRAAARRDSATDQHRWPGAAVGIAGSSAVIELAVAAEYGTDLPQAAERVRRAVIEDVTRLGGLAEVSVDITIDDVWL